MKQKLDPAETFSLRLRPQHRRLVDEASALDAERPTVWARGVLLTAARERKKEAEQQSAA